MYYSKMVGGFIPDEWLEDGTYSPVPEDVIEVTAQEVAQFHGVTVPGKAIDVVNGRLVWIDNPATAPDNVAIAQHMKDALILEASRMIEPLKDASDGGYIEDDDKLKLTAWQKYRYALTKVAPEKPVWPAKPDVKSL